MNVEEASKYYLEKKLSGELSLGDIRKELAASSLSEAEINAVCLKISDGELDALKEKKMFAFDFLDNNYFSLFMILATGGIFVFALLRYLKLEELEAAGAEIGDADWSLPWIFMIGSVIYLIRHVFKILKRRKVKAQ